MKCLFEMVFITCNLFFELLARIIYIHIYEDQRRHLDPYSGSFTIYLQLFLLEGNFTDFQLSYIHQGRVTVTYASDRTPFLEGSEGSSTSIKGTGHFFETQH